MSVKKINPPENLLNRQPLTKGRKEFRKINVSQGIKNLERNEVAKKFIPALKALEDLFTCFEDDSIVNYEARQKVLIDKIYTRHIGLLNQLISNNANWTAISKFIKGKILSDVNTALDENAIKDYSQVYLEINEAITSALKKYQLEKVESQSVLESSSTTTITEKTTVKKSEKTIELTDKEIEDKTKKLIKSDQYQDFVSEFKSDFDDFVERYDKFHRNLVNSGIAKAFKNTEKIYKRNNILFRGNRDSKVSKIKGPEQALGNLKQQQNAITGNPKKESNDLFKNQFYPVVLKSFKNIKDKSFNAGQKKYGSKISWGKTIKKMLSIVFFPIKLMLGVITKTLKVLWKVVKGISKVILAPIKLLFKGVTGIVKGVFSLAGKLIKGLVNFVKLKGTLGSVLIAMMKNPVTAYYLGYVTGLFWIKVVKPLYADMKLRVAIVITTIVNFIFEHTSITNTGGLAWWIFNNIEHKDFLDPLKKIWDTVINFLTMDLGWDPEKNPGLLGFLKHMFEWGKSKLSFFIEIGKFLSGEVFKFLMVGYLTQKKLMNSAYGASIALLKPYGLQAQVLGYTIMTLLAWLGTLIGFKKNEIGVNELIVDDDNEFEDDYFLKGITSYSEKQSLHTTVSIQDIPMGFNLNNKKDKKILKLRKKGLKNLQAEFASLTAQFKILNNIKSANNLTSKHDGFGVDIAGTMPQIFKDFASSYIIDENSPQLINVDKFDIYWYQTGRGDNNDVLDFLSQLLLRRYDIATSLNNDLNASGDSAKDKIIKTAQLFNHPTSKSIFGQDMIRTSTLDIQSEDETSYYTRARNAYNAARKSRNKPKSKSKGSNPIETLGSSVNPVTQTDPIPTLSHQTQSSNGSTSGVPNTQPNIQGPSIVTNSTPTDAKFVLRNNGEIPSNEKPQQIASSSSSSSFKPSGLTTTKLRLAGNGRQIPSTTDEQPTKHYIEKINEQLTETAEKITVAQETFNKQYEQMLRDLKQSNECIIAIANNYENSTDSYYFMESITDTRTTSETFNA